MGIPVVFDCMVFLQAAARRESVAGACLALAEQHHLDLCLSEPILAEIRDVLSRPEIRATFPSLNDNLVGEFLEAVVRFGRTYPSVGQHFSFPRDPKDEPYLNLAIAAGATYLASRDNDILDLRTGTDPSALEFRSRFPDIRIVEPLELLREIRTELSRSTDPTPRLRNPERGR